MRAKTALSVCDLVNRSGFFLFDTIALRCYISYKTQIASMLKVAQAWLLDGSMLTYALERNTHCLSVME